MKPGTEALKRRKTKGTPLSIYCPLLFHSVRLYFTRTHTHTSQLRLADGRWEKGRTAWSRCCWTHTSEGKGLWSSEPQRNYRRRRKGCWLLRGRQQKKKTVKRAERVSGHVRLSERAGETEQKKKRAVHPCEIHQCLRRKNAEGVTHADARKTSVYLPCVSMKAHTPTHDFSCLLTWYTASNIKKKCI